MPELAPSLGGDVLVFVAAAALIAVAGTKLAGYADRLADRTGMGEALTGTLFLGLVTALPGLAASLSAALQGHPELALGNAIGGIAFQTTILAVADVVHRDANLEHAAASVENMIQTILLIGMMTLVLAGMSGPAVEVGPVHPMSVLLLGVAVLAFWVVHRVAQRPMWRPRRTSETVEDVPDPEARGERLSLLVLGVIASGALTLAAGFLVARAAGRIVDESEIPGAIVGGLFMAIATSFPELVTCIAAVRRRALTLAVADIVGGNFFDVLFIAVADLAYRGGSLYHAASVGRREFFVVCLTILLNVVMLTGLIYRQRHGPGNIGLESVAMLTIYVVGFLVLALAM